MTKTKKTRAPPRPSPRPKTKTHKARLRHLISQRNPFSRSISQRDKNEIKRLLKETQAKESKAVLRACFFLAGIFGMAGVLGMISSGGGAGSGRSGYGSGSSSGTKSTCFDTWETRFTYGWRNRDNLSPQLGEDLMNDDDNIFIVFIFESYYRPEVSKTIHKKTYKVSTTVKKDDKKLIVTCSKNHDIISFTFIFTEDEQKIKDIILSRINNLNFSNNGHIQYSKDDVAKEVYATISYGGSTKTFYIDYSNEDTRRVKKVVNS